DGDLLRTLQTRGRVRVGLNGQDPDPAPGLCAEDCLGRAHRQLQQHCAAPLPVFCQARATPAATPAQPGLRAALGRLGYRFAFGARNGLVDTRCDPLDLPRIEVDAAIAARPGRLAWRIYRGARP
ncbi:polysaccharide deacetylase family protein, partial [Pseudomonas aeruginosa]|nr:polysaccharide deacetylase family protein [Pseudomonas aeruginosa]